MAERLPAAVLVVVQCRFNSRRLPGKALAPLGGVTMLEFLLRRLAPCAARPGVVLVVATTELEDDDRVVECAEALGVPVVRGATDDVLSRYMRCLAEYPARSIIRVTADNPLTCPETLDRVIDCLNEKGPDYMMVEGLPYGAAVDGFRAGVLAELGGMALSAAEREHINLHILNHLDRYRVERLRIPDEVNFPELRLTVDTDEDFRFVASLFSDAEVEPWTIPLKEAVGRAMRSCGVDLWRPFAQWADLVFGGTVPPRLAVRVDASRLPGLSFGHAARCLLMARVLRERGCAVTFLMQSYADGVRYISEHGFPVIPVADVAGFRETLRAVEELDAGWLLVDLPYDDLDTEALEKAGRSGTKVVLLDDSRLLFPAVEAVLNSSVRAVGLDGVPPEGPRRAFLGPRYFLLDEKRPLTRASAGADKRLLLTFGGSDPTRLTEAVLRALTGMSLDDVSFTVVLGPGYGAPTPVELLVAALNRSTILRAPRDLLKVMADHDLVICGGGRTMYEAWVQGIPFMPIGSAAHEAQEIKGFLERGLIRFGLEEMDGAAFGRMLERFLQ